MTDRMSLMREISRLKKELNKIAKLQEYDFNHPEVISISKNLDHLILQLMREQQQQ